jgi:hypothetical protein
MATLGSKYSQAGLCKTACSVTELGHISFHLQSESKLGNPVVDGLAAEVELNFVNQACAKRATKFWFTLSQQLFM